MGVVPVCKMTELLESPIRRASGWFTCTVQRAGTSCPDLWFDPSIASVSPHAYVAIRKRPCLLHMNVPEREGLEQTPRQPAATILEDDLAMVVAIASPPSGVDPTLAM